MNVAYRQWVGVRAFEELRALLENAARGDGFTLEAIATVLPDQSAIHFQNDSEGLDLQRHFEGGGYLTDWSHFPDFYANTLDEVKKEEEKLLDAVADDSASAQFD